MAKKSVTESTFAKNPKGVYTVGQKSDLPADVVRMRAGPTVTRSLKGDIKPPPAMGAKRIGAVANKYSAPIGPMGRATVPGGKGIMALNDVRLGPTAGAPRATVANKPQPMSGPIKARVKPAETIRTFVREKLTPTRKTGPQMALNRVTGNTTGFTSGVKTGKTISKAGVATKTPMSASRRAEQNAFNKGGVAGPSRGGGGSRSSGGMGKSSGGGRGMTGGGGMGASGRGTGGKR